jgi:hypothetical protein
MATESTRARRGTAALEFTLAGTASIMLLISTFALSMGMWNYHTLAYMVHEGTRFVAVRGIGCTTGSNTCSVTIGNIASQLAFYGIGLPSNSVNVTLKTNSGATTNCNPLNTCFSNSTVWPPASNSDNALGSLITISASYHYQSALLFFWPGQQGFTFGQVYLPATSTQTIIF